MTSKQVTNVIAETNIAWKINYFELTTKIGVKCGEYYVSQEFRGPFSFITWQLRVYPNGRNRKTKGKVCIFLVRTNFKRGEINTAAFSIYTFDANDKKVELCSNVTEKFTKYMTHGICVENQEASLFKALRKDGSLILYCDVKYFDLRAKKCIEPPLLKV